MSDFEMKDGSGMPEEERKLGSDGGFVSDTSCGSEYERHEGHSHSTDGERGSYSRSERDDYYTSGSGDGSFYRRDTSGMPSGGTSGGAAPSEEKKEYKRTCGCLYGMRYTEYSFRMLHTVHGNYSFYSRSCSGYSIAEKAEERLFACGHNYCVFRSGVRYNRLDYRDCKFRQFMGFYKQHDR